MISFGGDGLAPNMRLMIVGEHGHAQVVLFKWKYIMRGCQNAIPC